MSRYTTGGKGHNGGRSGPFGSTGRVCRRGAARGCTETMTPDARTHGVLKYYPPSEAAQARMDAKRIIRAHIMDMYLADEITTEQMRAALYVV